MNGARVGIGELVLLEKLSSKKFGIRSKVVRKIQEGEETDIVRSCSKLRRSVKSHLKIAHYCNTYYQ